MRLYGRRKGKKLRPLQEALLQSVLPRLSIALPASGEPIDPRQFFPPGLEDVWLEIGFGGGEHLAALASTHPGTGFIGCEPYVNGVVKLLAAVECQHLANLRIFPDDARLLLGHLAPHSLGRVFALFPDPWPKLRHHRRRLIQPAILDLIAGTMAEGAELRLATDDEEYAASMRETLAAHLGFEALLDSAERPAGWPATRYEAKAERAGRRPAYLVYRRRGRAAPAG
ncbi:MAG: tRNA (guanosine(46)-N7)-methyltransferase TrmB [Alphaproteobacteria bacterium]